MLELVKYSPIYKEDILRLDKEYLTGSFKDLNTSDNDIIILALDNNKVVGFLYIIYVCLEADIVSICVDKSSRGKGIAKKLLNYMFDNYDLEACFLEVREDNIPAIGLYKYFNFETISVRKKYYSDNTNALMMKWSS